MNLPWDNELFSLSALTLILTIITYILGFKFAKNHPMGGRF